MKLIFWVVTLIALLEAYALYNNLNGVMFSASVGSLSALGGGVITYLKMKGKRK